MRNIKEPPLSKGSWVCHPAIPREPDDGGVVAFMKSKNDEPSYFSLAYDAYQRERESQDQSEIQELWKDAYVESLRLKIGFKNRKSFYFFSRMILYLLPHAGFIILFWVTAENPWDKSIFIPLGIWFLGAAVSSGVILHRRMKKIFRTERHTEKTSPVQGVLGVSSGDPPRAG